MNNMSWIITSISYIISLSYLQMCKSPSMTSCLWSKFAEFKLWGWRCTLWWWKRRSQSWYAFFHKGLHAWQVQCLTNTFFNVCWWHRLDRVVYNARKRDGTILGGDDGCSKQQARVQLQCWSRDKQTNSIWRFRLLQGLFATLEEPLFAECHPLVTLLSSELICLQTLSFCLETQHLLKFNFG